ncbi:cytochrome c oxidase assembly protein [Marinicauda salina]|uniref:Cytochrome c oxidase assembly protein CtaG n=1 Tax=Marinicauda salina TaxID=2135793 RepID=A0A2U2BUH3_9PROT|nr:cytochrome c oxidase assembly protein [Marinicauda salina]PWE17658.1 cytochrome c oxidase assembly protein [Marinicauda salina]
MKRFLPKDPNVRILAICVTVVGSMVAAAYAAVPLYDLFCRVTGYGGTTQVAAAESRDVLDRTVTVRFDASNSRDFPWEFEPVQREMELRVGETGLAYYRATNPTDRTITGTATYNVSPFKAAPYFSKIECFCFTAQTLGPGESMDMPVMFFVDPEMDAEDRLDDVRTITLSYTFWEAEDGASRTAQAQATEDRS